MQLSNGLSDPIGLWLGHLLWDSVFGVIIATIIVIIFAAVSDQFYGLGLFVSRFPSRWPSFPVSHRLRSVGRPCTIRRCWRTVFVLCDVVHVIPSHIVRRRRWIPDYYVCCK